MRVWVLTALLLAPVVGVSLGPNVTADESVCAQTFGEVPVGTGPLPAPLPVPVLNGISYVDVPFHSCSNGGYFLEADSEQVQATRICTEQIVRVYAVAGAAGEDFVVNWQPKGKNDC